MIGYAVQRMIIPGTDHTAHYVVEFEAGYGQLVPDTGALVPIAVLYAQPKVVKVLSEQGVDLVTVDFQDRSMTFKVDLTRFDDLDQFIARFDDPEKSLMLVGSQV